MGGRTLSDLIQLLLPVPVPGPVAWGTSLLSPRHAVHIAHGEKRRHGGCFGLYRVPGRARKHSLEEVVTAGAHATPWLVM